METRPEIDKPRFDAGRQELRPISHGYNLPILKRLTILFKWGFRESQSHKRHDEYFFCVLLEDSYI